MYLFFQSDPFINIDPFGGSFSSTSSSNKKTNESFDLFGGGSNSKAPSVSFIYELFYENKYNFNQNEYPLK